MQLPRKTSSMQQPPKQPSAHGALHVHIPPPDGIAISGGDVQVAAQVPLQQTWLVAHVLPPQVHCPEVQVPPMPHVRPHEPQF
jgi:hypothetical protein